MVCTEWLRLQEKGLVGTVRGLEEQGGPGQRDDEGSSGGEWQKPAMGDKCVWTCGHQHEGLGCSLPPIIIQYQRGKVPLPGVFRRKSARYRREPIQLGPPE